MSNYNILDVRQMPETRRTLAIFQAFESIHPGGAFVLVIDADPEPLHNHFNTELSGRFEWTNLEQACDGWRVLISKTH